MEYIYAEKGKARYEITVEEGDFFIAFRASERLAVERVLIAIAPLYNTEELKKLYDRVRISHTKAEEQ